MPLDIEDHDLYPPDVDRRDETPEARHARNRAAVGTALLVWGTSLLLHRSMHVDLDTGFLGLGLGALVGWTQLRRYAWFVAGAVLTALGLGEVLGVVMSGAFGSMVTALLLAGGFAAIYVRYPQRSRWALVPAAVFAVFAVVAFGFGLLGMVPRLLFGGFFLPFLLVAAGGLLVFRQSLPPRVVKIGLATLAGMFVLSAGSNVSWSSVAGRETAVLPIEGRKLVLTGGSGDLEIVQVDSAGSTVSVRGRQRHLSKLVSERAVTLAYGSGDYEVRVPKGVEVSVVTGSGDVEIETVEDVAWEVDTGSGDIDVDGDDYDDEGYQRSGSEMAASFSVRTGSGDVEIDTDS